MVTSGKSLGPSEEISDREKERRRIDEALPASETKPRPFSSYALILILVILAAGIITVGCLHYRNYARHYRAEVERQISAIADLKVRSLVQYRKERLGDAHIFFKNAVFSALVKRWFEKPADRDTQAQIQPWLGQVKEDSPYDRVFLLDAKGVERMSVPNTPEPVAPDLLRRLSEILHSEQVMFWDFHRDAPGRPIHLSLLVPILDPLDGHSPLGILVMRINPEDYLYPLISEWPTPSKTAETLIVRRDGGDALYLNEPRFKKNAALNLRVPLENKEVPAVRAVLGREGIVEGVDYRGVPALASVRAVPDSPWFLVARMDASEVYAPLREWLWTMVGMVGVLLLGAGAAVAFVNRRQSLGFYRERYEAAEDLRESQRQIEFILGATTTGLDIIDSQFNLRYVDPEWAKVYGDWAGRKCHDYFMGRGGPCPGCGIVQALQTRQMSVTEEILVKENNRPIQVTTIPYQDKNGEWLCAEVNADLTERKRMEEQLRKSQRLESIGQLGAGVAHDFNNLLQALLGYVQLGLKRSSPGEQNHDDLKEIQGLAERGAALTRQLLIFGGQQTLQPEDLDLNRVVGDLLKMLRRVIGEDAELEFNGGPGLQTVHADRGQIEQVLMNLCLNARDAMANGGRIVIETQNVFLNDAYRKTHPWAREGGHVLLIVSDTGAGMSRKVQERIFEPFFTTKEQGNGTGLGLATVYGIVKQHGGDIQVYSEPGQGSTFKIYLPSVGRPPARLQNEAQAPVVGGRETILIAEDEEMVRMVVCRVLEEAGYTVLTASDGQEAVNLFKAEQDRIDLALLDAIMPKLSGLEACQQIRAVKPDIRVLFSSGYSARVMEPDSIPGEGVDLIAKPYNPDDLLRRVRHTLNRA